MSITFIHAADIHLGLENYGKIDRETGLSQRFLDYLEALNKLVETAVSEDVDFVVLAGDIYKNPNPSSTVRRELIRILKKLQERQLPVIVILGNHDQATAFGKAHAFGVFSVLGLPALQVIDSPRLVLLDTKKGRVQLICVPWPQRSDYFQSDTDNSYAAADYFEELSRRVGVKIQELVQATSAHLPTMFFGHLMVKGAAFSGTEGMLSLGKDPLIDPKHLNNKRFSYVGLGHVHRLQDLNKLSAPPIIYAGSLCRIDFQEKDDRKGFVLGRLFHDKLSFDFHEVKDRPFLEIEINITDEENPTADFIEQLKEHDLTEAVLKIGYHIDAEVESRLNWRQIHRHLQTCHYLVSIVPRKPLISKVPRLEINESFGIEKAFSEYVKLNPALNKDSKKLSGLLSGLIKETDIQ